MQGGEMYAALGGITNFSSLIDGVDRLTPEQAAALPPPTAQEAALAAAIAGTPILGASPCVFCGCSESRCVCFCVVSAQAFHGEDLMGE